jgi:hypothetical protein
MNPAVVCAAITFVCACCGFPALVAAHCDSIDGPVVRDARAALEKRDPTAVLKWVGREQEEEVRTAFARTLAVRGLGSDARQLADQYFFETLVRVHRAGEGEPFTGRKPTASSDPGIATADMALVSGAGAPLAEELADKIASGIRRRFDLALARKKHADGSIEAGREYVSAYVDYIHFVENVHRLASVGATHQHHELEPVRKD